jgi:phosphate/sulfate permease
LSAVRWGITFEIFLSWLLTVPVTIGLGALFMTILARLVAML